jgi:uncharacterized protein
MDERGAPTPVAWTRLRAPESLMGPADPTRMDGTVSTSPLRGRYAGAVDRESAREILAARLEAGAAKARAENDTGSRDGHDGRVKYPERSRRRTTDRGDYLVSEVRRTTERSRRAAPRPR